MSVGEPVVVVEYHDCGHHRRGHHEHDAVEICACFLVMGEKSKGDMLARFSSVVNQERRFVATKILSGGGGSRYGFFFSVGKRLCCAHFPLISSWQIP